VLTAVVTLLTSVSVVGDTLSDPGGWVGSGLVAVWLIATLVVTALVLRRRDLAGPLLTAATLAGVALAAWAVVPSSDWTALEDRVGPIRAVVVVGLTGLLGLLGWFRPRPAAWLLFLVGITPPLGTALGWVLGALVGSETSGLAVSISWQLTSTPALVIGALYLLAEPPVRTRQG
jgi:hypothetical protein